MQNPWVTCNAYCKKVRQETVKENEVNLIQPTEPVSSEQGREGSEEEEPPFMFHQIQTEGWKGTFALLIADQITH